MIKKCFLALGFVTLFSTLHAQLPQLPVKGHLSGSFESFTQRYQKDEKINAIPPQDNIGSNNFFKLDYSYGAITAGIQYESYLPAIQGFPFASTKKDRNESKLVNKYFRYATDKFSIQLGDFYEQFGSGLVLRAWENRQIGVNNAIEGVNIKVNVTDFFKLKAVYGRPRKYFDYANALVRGVDGEIDIMKLVAPTKIAATNITTGFSYVNRYQEYTGTTVDFPSNVQAYAARLNVDGQSASLGIEYVNKSKDPHTVNLFNDATGNALLINAGFTKNNFGINFTGRSMSNMDFRAERSADGTLLPVNYIPALTKQHDYLTTNIYVYNAQSAGETGGQLDVFYNFPKGCLLGGKKGAKISANFARYTALKETDKFLTFGEAVYFQDFNVEYKKKFGSKWLVAFAYHNVQYNKEIIEAGFKEIVKSHIGIVNALYRYTPKKSLRFELQHLYTKEDLGNWAAAVTEFTFAPYYSFYLSDLYNYGVSGNHYYNVGGSIMKNATRFSLSYGRQRAGLLCVGGVCRFVPAASGFTATLTLTINN